MKISFFVLIGGMMVIAGCSPTFVEVRDGAQIVEQYRCIQWWNGSATKYECEKKETVKK